MATAPETKPPRQEGSIVTLECSTGDREDGIKRTKFNLRPIFIVMAVCGCYSFPNERRKIPHTVFWLYKIFLVMVILLYMVRTLVLLTDISMLLSICTVIFLCLQSLANLIISWKAFSKTCGHFYKTMKQFETVLSRMALSNISINRSYFRRRQLGLVVGVLIIILSGFVVQAMMTYVLLPSPGDFGLNASNQSLPYTAPFEDTMGTRTLLLVAFNLCTVPYATPAFCLMTISYMMITVFKALNTRLDHVFEIDQEHVFDKLENLRKIHVELCSTVSRFDRDLGLLYGNIFFWTILEGILVLYILVKFQVGSLVQLSMVYYLILAFAILASMAILAAIVHEEAHSPLNVIYYINVEGVNLEKVTQLNLFLSKLTGTQVGFTIFGLLVITKEFILTLAGVFVSYFAVLYTL